MQPFIEILDDDSLLNIFRHCQPAALGQDQDTTFDDILAGAQWERDCWWYKLVQVCQRWRYLILGSPSHLRLSLVCTYGTSVADMLAHWPSLPIVINHLHADHNITADDEEGIILALQHRDRVRCIRLRMPLEDLRRPSMAMDGNFPILEYLYIGSLTGRTETSLLPESFQAPRLRHLLLRNFGFPIKSPLLATTTGLVTLSLEHTHPSAYLTPNALLQRLSLMPGLGTLRIISYSPSHSHSHSHHQDALLNTPITTHVTLPNLRHIEFEGVSTYFEVLLPQISAPLLQILKIVFYEQPTFPIPHLLRFINTAENFKFEGARVRFVASYFVLTMYRREGTRTYLLSIRLFGGHLVRQVASAVQIFGPLRTVLSVVEYLTLEHYTSLEFHGEASRAHWQHLLRTFSNVKTLRVSSGLVEQLFRSLRSTEDGESPMELLPKLKELSFSANEDVVGGESFRAFIDARRDAGHPVTLSHR